MSERTKAPRRKPSNEVDGYMAICLREKPGEPWGPPLIVNKKEDRYYWWGGPSYACHKSESVKLVRKYPFGSEDAPDWEDLELKFHQEFPPKASKPCKSGGWISPEGKFYTCGSMGHTSLANALAAALYTSQDGMATLEDKGWCHLYTDGQTYMSGSNKELAGGDVRLTPDQVKTLGRIAHEMEDKAAKKIHDAIKLYTDEQED